MKFEHENSELSLDLHRLVIAGWTGRDAVGIQHHIEELAALGVAPPSATPLFYECDPASLTQSDEIRVLGDTSSGEAEPLILKSEGRVYLGLGSDHTDRALEVYGVAQSKYICPKPVARTLWDFDDVKNHADELILRSWIEEGGQEALYQDGTLAAIRPLAELVEGAGLQDGEVMFCGTIGAIGGVRPAMRFRAALIDPVLAREIHLSYRMNALDVVS